MHQYFHYLILFGVFWVVLQTGIYYLKKRLQPKRLPFMIGLQSVTPQEHVAMKAWWDSLSVDDQYKYQDDIFTAWRGRKGTD